MQKYKKLSIVSTIHPLKITHWAEFFHISLSPFHFFVYFCIVNVYFYHTQDLQMILPKVEQGTFPPHLLYGATKLSNHGINVVWHKSRLGLPRWRMMLRNAWHILTCREHIDALYATHYRGIELIVLLRALGLYRKPIVIWHHQPIITPKALWREWLGRLFYRGFDHMFFFSQKLIDDSLKSRKARPERMHLGHWGMDITTPLQLPQDDGGVFISTGKEMRDMPTLIKAFNETGAPLDVYINKQNGDVHYADIFAGLEVRDNIHIHWTDRLMPFEISQLVAKAKCVVICCQETKYTVGLTTVVEALALGKPIICSRNPQIPVDFDREGCGISVPYYDVEGWAKAIRYIEEHPEEAKEMGHRGQELARTTYNDTRVAQEAADVLHQCKS